MLLCYCVLTGGRRSPPRQNNPNSTISHWLKALIGCRSADHFWSWAFDRSLPNALFLSDLLSYTCAEYRPFLLNRLVAQHSALLYWALIVFYPFILTSSTSNAYLALHIWKYLWQSYDDIAICDTVYFYLQPQVIIKCPQCIQPFTYWAFTSIPAFKKLTI